MFFQSQNKKGRILLFGAMIAVLALIQWHFSSQSGSLSQMQSDLFLGSLRDGSLYRTASFLLRKSAHFLMYLSSGVFSMLFFLETLPPDADRKQLLIRIGLACLLCFTLASLDEFHQTFVPGRSGELRDVLLDFAGSCTGILSIILLNHQARLLLSARKHSQ